MEYKLELSIGMFAPTIEEQLKEFNIPNDKIKEWESIKNFIIRCHLLEKITDKQEEKLFECLVKEIGDYIFTYKVLKKEVRGDG